MRQVLVSRDCLFTVEITWRRSHKSAKLHGAYDPVYDTLAPLTTTQVGHAKRPSPEELVRDFRVASCGASYAKEPLEPSWN